MRCWKSAFNAQGLRVIVVIVQGGAMKIYVAAVKRKDETKLSLPPKIGGKPSLGPSCFVL